jgi:hypothetical protein
MRASWQGPGGIGASRRCPAVTDKHSDTAANDSSTVMEIMPLTPGTPFGSYEITGPLATSGMGAVFRAHAFA